MIALRKSKDAAVPAPTKSADKDKAQPEVDHELDGLMSEIESDLRDDEFRKIWRRYGHVIVGAVIALVAGVFGVQAWRQYETDARAALATRYTVAARALDAGQYDDALAGFGEVAAKPGEGYAALARLGQAAAQIQKKDLDGAIATYKALAGDTRADPIFRDLATVLRVLHSLDRDDPKTLEAVLTPLLAPNNAFNHSALELSALLAAKQGDNARAAKLAEQIVTNANAPQGLRQRAQDLGALFKIGVPSVPPESASAAPAALAAPAAPVAPAAPAAAPAPPAPAPAANKP